MSDKGKQKQAKAPAPAKDKKPQQEKKGADGKLQQATKPAQTKGEKSANKNVEQTQPSNEEKVKEAANNAKSKTPPAPPKPVVLPSFGRGSAIQKHFQPPPSYSKDISNLQKEIKSNTERLVPRPSLVCPSLFPCFLHVPVLSNIFRVYFIALAPITF